MRTAEGGDESSGVVDIRFNNLNSLGGESFGGVGGGGAGDTANVPAEGEELLCDGTSLVRID